MKKKDGGLAFPRVAFKTRTSDAEIWYPKEDGMSLRDYIATHALGMVLEQNSENLTPEDYAKIAYLYADAMIEEREK